MKFERVLVTGTGGQLGSYVVAELAIFAIRSRPFTTLRQRATNWVTKPNMICDH
jgi:hypothetical protein